MMVIAKMLLLTSVDGVGVSSFRSDTNIVDQKG